MNKFTAFVATLALAGSARSQMIQTTLAPAAGAPAINFAIPLAAGPATITPLTATPLSLTASLLAAPAPAPLAAIPAPIIRLAPVPVKEPYDLPGPVASARLAVLNPGAFDGAKAGSGDASPVSERPLPRGAGLSEKEAVAKISADAKLGADELKVSFPAGTTAKEARAVLTRLELLAWLSPARSEVALRRSPGGEGLYAVFTPSSTGSRAVMAGYALARRPETQSVTLGRDLKRAWDALNR